MGHGVQSSQIRKLLDYPSPLRPAAPTFSWLMVTCDHNGKLSTSLRYTRTNHFMRYMNQETPYRIAT